MSDLFATEVMPIAPGRKNETEVCYVNQALDAACYARSVRGDCGREKHPAQIPEALRPVHQLLQTPSQRSPVQLIRAWNNRGHEHGSCPGCDGFAHVGQSLH